MSEEVAPAIKRERAENDPSSPEAVEDPPAKKVKTDAEQQEQTVVPPVPEAPVNAAPESIKPESTEQKEDPTEAVAPISNGGAPAAADEAVAPEEPTQAVTAPDDDAAASASGKPDVDTEVDPKKEPETSTEPSKEAPTPEASVTAPPSGLPPAASPVDPTVAATITNPNSIVEERGEVSAQYVGKVIGKGGEMLRDLQARAGCRLDVDQNVPHGNPRILTYRGTRKTVDLAKQMVSMLCTPQGNEGNLPLGEARRKDLMVPASSVGKIIGRAGEMVRELQSRSQAKIQVDHTGKAYNSDTRSVSIIGTTEAVVKAEEMVLFLVANPLLDAMKAIRMLVDDKLKSGGRWGSGPPYVSMPNQGQNMAPMDGGGGYNNGPPQNQQFGGGGGGGGGYQQGGPPSGQGGYGGPPPHQQQQQGVGGYQNDRGSESEIFPAAKMYMGRIIGQRGATINDLQKRSGCDIQINQDVAPGQDCVITIKGARQGVEHTKQMLREIIEMGPNHPYAGGGGQYQQQGNQQQGGYQQPANNYMQQAPMHGGYQQQQQQGQQMYGHHQQQQPYGGQHHAPPQQYAPPMQQQQQYGMPPYQQPGGYPPQAAPGYRQQQLPPMAAPVPMWKSATAADGQVYYYNEKTGETQWDKPPGVP
mmetsp:Transcript_28604/g.47338  ORF Transcript_28604/g.47338 Transcript_28604/m.47338 type:complete len:643 (-) Transcript_28604:330-2258(-)|eukprot:CAMPEP_0119029264 /NCGR_PEP_ID=MMETSP1176-20130426/40400_1 /TAXON_ID=265551 /ORGANISM="Synedropsis recta cf, Strain CCMP1620" /LENGTH=642 /DNA_ID=CAMNT_0006985589 /DNA_START=17 /DNA_END=1945 /DNA_ORIENTATION=-